MRVRPNDFARRSRRVAPPFPLAIQGTGALATVLIRDRRPNPSIAQRLPDPLRGVLQKSGRAILLRQTMTTLKKPVALLLLLALGALLAGCNTKSQQESAIPWSRPAGWEGQIPGMSTSSGR